jgi:hypothetical protein
MEMIFVMVMMDHLILSSLHNNKSQGNKMQARLSTSKIGDHLCTQRFTHSRKLITIQTINVETNRVVLQFDYWGGEHTAFVADVIDDILYWASNPLLLSP